MGRIFVHFANRIFLSIPITHSRFRPLFLRIHRCRWHTEFARARFAAITVAQTMDRFRQGRAGAGHFPGQLALAYTRSWAANSPNERIRLAGQADQLQQEAALLARRDPHQGRSYGQNPRKQTAPLRTDRKTGHSPTAGRSLLVVGVTRPKCSKSALPLSLPGASDSTRKALMPYSKLVNQSTSSRNSLRHRTTSAITVSALGQSQDRPNPGSCRATSGDNYHRPDTPRTADYAPEKPRVKTMPSAKRVTADRPNHVWHADFTTVPSLPAFGFPGCRSR